MPDMKFNQDRMQAKDINYISNRSEINKIVLGHVQKYRKYLADLEREEFLSLVDIILQRCVNIAFAIEAVGVELGLI